MSRWSDSLKDIGVRASYEGSRARSMNYNVELNNAQSSLTPFRRQKAVSAIREHDILAE